MHQALTRCVLCECAQDSLAEGMHLIDFEQLKMENVTLREKIEERGDEVARLRRKTHATVQASERAWRPRSSCSARIGPVPVGCREAAILIGGSFMHTVPAPCPTGCGTCSARMRRWSARSRLVHTRLLQKAAAATW